MFTVNYSMAVDCTTIVNCFPVVHSALIKFLKLKLTILFFVGFPHSHERVFPSLAAVVYIAISAGGR